MKELNNAEVALVNGGDVVTAIGIGLGFIGAFNALTSFGAGLGAGIYDGIHNQHH